ELAVQSIRILVRSALMPAAPSSAYEPQVPSPRQDRPLPEGGVFEALVRVFYSPYLMGIAVYMLLYTVTTTFLYFDQAHIVKTSIDGRDAQTAYLAKIDLYYNLATLALQAFATSRIIGLLGVGGSMTILPLVTGAGYALLCHRPTTTVLLWFQVGQ